VSSVVKAVAVVQPLAAGGTVAKLAAVVPAATGGTVVPKSTRCKKAARWRKIVNSTGGKYIATVRAYIHPTKVKKVPVLEICVVATTAKARKADKLYITWDKPGKNSRVSTTGRKLSSTIATIKEGQRATALVDYFFTDKNGDRQASYFPELPFVAAAP
jgi:ribosomal protein L14